MKITAYLLLPVSVLALSLSATAADESLNSTPNYAEDTITGDWGDTRTELFRKGLGIDLGYRADLLRNTAGGLARGGQLMKHLDIKLAADLEKLLNWPGGSAMINLIHDGGGKLNSTQVGSLTGVSNIEVGTNTHRFYQFWLQQEFAEGRTALLAGLFPIDTEFQVMDSAGLFVQPPYGASADLSLTRGPSIFNNPAFGIRGRWLVSKESGTYVQAAVLDGNPGDPNNPRGTHIHFDKGDGSMSIAELGLKPPSPAGEAGGAQHIEKYAAGYWRYSTRVPDQENPLTESLSRGWYALTERTLYRGSGDLAGFFRLSGTDGDSTPIKRAINVGLRAKALISGRSEDIAGIAYTRAVLSRKYRAVQELGGTPTGAYEDAWEITYRIKASQWLALQPVLQFINHPGGNLSLEPAHIIGTRIDLTF